MKRKVIALTGGIGSGKSTVGNLLKVWGFPVVDCDQLSKQVATDGEVLQEIVRLLGKECVVDGKLNRQVVRAKIFADSVLYEKYSQLFWDKIRLLLQSAVQNSGEVVFVEIPVLDAFPFDWTEVWVVTSSRLQQIERVVKRDGTTPLDVQNIMSKQKTFVGTREICNDGTLEQLKKTLLETLNKAQISLL